MNATDDVVAELRRRAMLAAYEAEGAAYAYRQAAKELERRRIFTDAGIALPSECLLNGEHVYADEIECDYGTFGPRLIYRIKSKSGAWGKTQYTHSLPADIRPTLPKSPQPAD